MRTSPFLPNLSLSLSLVVSVAAAGVVSCGGDDGGAATGATTTGPGTTTDPVTTDPGTSTSIGGSSGGASDSSDPTTTTGPVSECGNAVPEAGEECDDGNDVEGDGCNTDCTENTDTQQWEVTHDGAQGNTDVGYGIDADSVGNVIAVGYTFEPDSQADIWIRKYDPSGTELWTSNVLGMAMGGDDRAFAVSVNAADEIYVVGTIQDTVGNSDIWLRKHDPDGTEIWTATYDGPNGGDDWGYAVDVSAAGIAVVGASNTNTGNDIFVRMYDDTGAAVWTDVVDGPTSATDQGRGVALDSAGNVYAAGWINVLDQSEDAWLRKYDPAGVEVWTEIYQDTSGGPDQFFSAAIDPDDNVIVAGSTRKGVAGDNVLVRKHDPDGMLLLTAFYNAPASANDRANAVAVDADSNLIAAGYKTVGDADLDIWFRKYDIGGLVTWTQSKGGAAMQADEVHGAATDASGNILLIGELREGANTADIWIAKFAP